MSYNLAYTSQFHGTDGTRWSVEISILGFIGREKDIRLEHDEPLVIEWQETKKTDVVQSSTCTLKVSNETDRQMIELMTNKNAVCDVYRAGVLYWRGLLDDAVYEEPYSFSRSYVTELTFCDFGFLNRTNFTMTGKHSLREIVDDCLASAQLGSLQVTQMISLVSPKQERVALEHLFVSCDRFQPSGSDEEYPTPREVLEDILRPLGLRIMQKKGKIWVFDIEYLRDETNVVPVVWKGTDAYLRGSETFGIFDIEFDPNPEEDVIDGSIDPDKWNYVSADRFYAEYMDDDDAEREVGFYFEPAGIISSDVRKSRTRPYLSASSEFFYARRARCYDSVNESRRNILATYTPRNIDSVSEMLSFQSAYIPLATNRDQFQFRVSVDFLFTPKLNPFEDAEDWNLEIYETSWHTISWENWMNYMLRLYMPVKLEVLDGSGNVLYHYKNTNRSGGYLYPLNPGNGQWLPGAATWGEMLLAYYKPGDDGRLHETAFDGGWVTNKQVISRSRAKAPGIYKKRKDGEYVPLPPAPGFIKFTISNGLVGLVGDVEPQMLLNFDNYINWQLYKDPKVVLVRSDMIDDDVNKDNIKEEDVVDLLSGTFKEIGKIGCYRDGVAPCARGMLFDTYGLVWSKFIKNQSLRTLEEHRLRCVMDQTYLVQPELSGTAELNTEFCTHSDASTGGVFLVTALRQDPQSATEHVTMVRIAGVGGFIYDFSWGDPICVQEQEHYRYEWDDLVCVQTQKDIPVTPEEPPVQ